MQRFKAAVVQLRSTEDTEQNLKRAAELVRAAAADGAQLITLPENATFLRTGATYNVGETLSGRIITFFSDLAREVDAAILLGSFQELAESGHRVYNTQVLIGPDGAIVQKYRKVHLFDIDIPGQVTMRESDNVAPGNEAVIRESIAQFKAQFAT